MGLVVSVIESRDPDYNRMAFPAGCFLIKELLGERRKCLQRGKGKYGGAASGLRVAQVKKQGSLEAGCRNRVQEPERPEKISNVNSSYSMKLPGLCKPHPTSL